MKLYIYIDFCTLVFFLQLTTIDKMISLNLLLQINIYYNSPQLSVRRYPHQFLQLELSPLYATLPCGRVKHDSCAHETSDIFKLVLVEWLTLIPSPVNSQNTSSRLSVYFRSRIMDA